MLHFPKDDKSKNAETSQKPELGANPDQLRTLTLHRLYKFLGVSQLQQDKTPRLTMLKNRVTVSQNTVVGLGFFLPLPFFFSSHSYRAAPVAVRN